MQQPTHDPAVVEITPAVILRGAATYLIRHGWCQGDMFDLAALERAEQDGEPVLFPPACGLGAIRMAVFGTPDIDAESLTLERKAEFDGAVAAFADHLILSYDAIGDPDATNLLQGLTGWLTEEIVTDWNDDADRIAPHVIAALKGAADEWDRTHPGTSVPVCCGRPMRELDTSPDVWVFPGDPVCVERVYRCGVCRQLDRVEVTDPGERDRLFSEVACGKDGDE